MMDDHLGDGERERRPDGVGNHDGREAEQRDDPSLRNNKVCKNESVNESERYGDCLLFGYGLLRRGSEKGSSHTRPPV